MPAKSLLKRSRSVLLPLSVLAALMSGSPVWAQSATYDNSFVSALPTAKLTAATMHTFLCESAGYAYISQNTLGYTYTGNQVCNLLSAAPGFYSTTTPAFYKVNLCAPNAGQPAFIVVGNVLVNSGDRTGYGNETHGLFPSTTPTTATFDECNAPSATFTLPPGFTPAASDTPTIAFTSQYLQAASVPQDPNNPGYTTNAIQFGMTRVGDSGQALAIPYTLSGTAQNGTDYSYYDAASKSQAQPLGNAGTITALAGSSPASSLALIKYAPANHPEKTVTTTFTAPPGYTQIGSGVLTGRLLQQNVSNVSVTPINGTTVTPGSTTNGFTLTRTSGDQTQPLTVSYTIGGTAVNGTDYGYLSGVANIPANQSSLNIPLTVPARSGGTAIPQKDVSISLSAPADSSYNVPSSGSSGQSQDFIIPAYNPSTVTFAQGSGGGTLTPGQTQPFTVTRAGGDQTQPLTVNYTTGGTAQPGTDYQPVSSSVTIPANVTSVTVPLSAIQHTGTTAYPATTLTITPATGSGYDASGAQPINYNIPAYSPSTVSVSQPTNGGSIPAGGSLPFTVTRTGDTSQPLTIPYTVGGTATAPGDYTQMPGSITIPAGATSATQTIATPTPNGSKAQPSKTITITPQSGSSYTVDPTNGTATYTTAAYTPSSVSATAGSGGSTIAHGTTGGLTLTRTGSTATALLVSYTLSGTAVNGVDYNALPGLVTIPAGQSAVTVPVTVPTNTSSTAIPAKDLLVTVASGSGYAVDSTSSSTDLTITAASPNPGLISAPVSLPVISVGFDPTVPAFTVTRTGDPSQVLTVPVNFSGTGVPGVDYAQLPNAVTFSAGKTSVSVPVKLLPTATTGNTITASVPAGSGYIVGAGNGTSFSVPAGYGNTASTSGTTTVTTPATTAPTTGTKKRGSGATGFIVGAGAVGGTIAASTGALGSAAAAATGTGSLAVPGLLAGSMLGTVPQSCATTGETPTALVQLIPQLKDGNPDWNAVTFAQLTAPTQAGTVKLGHNTVSWQAGQPVSDIVHVGDTDGSFNLHCLGLSKLASLGRLGLAAKPLSTLNLVADTTLKGLSQSLYRRARTVGDVKGLPEWIAARSGGALTASQVSSLSFADLFQAHPTVAALPLGDVPLSQIPGYSDILLGDIPNWTSKTVSQVVGLQNVPFSQFPAQPKPLTALNK